MKSRLFETEGHPGRLAFMLTALSLIIYAILLSFSHHLLLYLVREDGWIENMGAALFLATAALMACVSLRLHRSGAVLLSGLFGVAAVAFVVAAGEEISWGQRIFDFQTPEKLAAINDQNEFNFHNIQKGPIDRCVHYAILLSGTAVILLSSFRITLLAGIPVPTLCMGYSLLMLPLLNHPEHLDKAYFLTWTVLALHLAHLVWKRRWKEVGLVSIAGAIGIMLLLVNLRHVQWIGQNTTPELRESLLATICLCYGFQIFRTMEPSGPTPTAAGH